MSLLVCVCISCNGLCPPLWYYVISFHSPRKIFINVNMFSFSLYQMKAYALSRLNNVIFFWPFKAGMITFGHMNWYLMLFHHLAAEMNSYIVVSCGWNGREFLGNFRLLISVFCILLLTDVCWVMVYFCG